MQDDTLVCYTNKENRDIAKLFVIGERDAQLLKYSTITINKINTDFINLSNEFNNCTRQYKNLINISDSIQTSNLNLNLKLNRSKYIIGGSIGLNIILLIILL